MPKIKTHSGAKKRIKLSGSGKLLRRHASQGHFLSKKDGGRKREFGKDHPVHSTQETSVKRMLGK